MPNVGKPSKGCKSCRDRKVKCDQKRPSCSQCIRAGKYCYGYRDELSMMFKNESDVVAKKAEKRYEALAKQKSLVPIKRNEDSEFFRFTTEWPSSRSRSDLQLEHSARYPTRESLIYELVPSIENQALGFFMSNYVARPSIVPRGQFEWVTELLGQPHVEEVLRFSVSAASLAGLANTTKSPVIMQKAQAAYVTALRMTNSALRVKKTAVKDSTLISVIMLGMYENMVFQDRQSIQAWAKHVDGACALLNSRGKDQFKSSVARRIFHQFYGTALLVALQAGTPVNEGMRELYQALQPTTDYDVHGRQWTTRIVDVMHDAINLLQDKTSDPVTLVTTALNIDREINEIKTLMPDIWHNETVLLDKPSEFLYGNQYHIYIDPWISQMWNNLRICQMGLFKVIRENLEKSNDSLLEDDIKAQKQATEDVLRKTAADIIASIPQIAGMIPFPTSSKLSPVSSPGSSSSPEKEDSRYLLHPPGTFLNPAKSTGLVHLIWPLYASAQDLASYEMRQWIIEMLEFIALRIGTKQAVVLLEELKMVQRTVAASDTSHRTAFTFENAFGT